MSEGVAVAFSPVSIGMSRGSGDGAGGGDDPIADSVMLASTLMVTAG